MTEEKQNEMKWAKQQLDSWKSAGGANTIIYTYAFVSSSAIADTKDGEKKLDFFSKLLLFVLVMVSLVIQTAIPIAIVATLDLPQGWCPNQANPLTKFFGLTLCLFFVVLTISMCLSKLRGMAFLKLFCSSDVKLLGFYRFFLDIGILANMTSMASAGIAQYMLFIRNAERDYVLLLLQSLAMQFVLTADEKLMSGSWKNWTKRRLDILIEHESSKSSLLDGANVQEEEDGLSLDVEVIDLGSNEVHITDEILKKVKLMYYSEAAFIFMVSVVGVTWSIALTVCM